MALIKEFKEFALKGNVIDLAIAVVIGAAFGNVVTSLTESILMPMLSFVMGKGGVADLKFTLGATVFPVGRLFQAVIDFILIALVLFGIIKAINTLQRKKEVAPKAPELSMTEKLLIEIRDAVKGKQVP